MEVHQSDDVIASRFERERPDFARRLPIGFECIGRIYQQTFLDTYSKMALVKLYDRKNALVAADLLNDRVLPFFEEHNVRLLRVLTDRGTEYCGNRECHEYQLYLGVEDIDHSRTKAKSPQTNGICERFHRTMQEEFYSVAQEALSQPGGAAGRRRCLTL